MFWALALLDVGAGLAFSPVTAADRVRVEGGQDFDRQRLARILSTLRDVPCARVNGYEIESRVLDLSEVKSANLSRNVFRRAVLEVEYRTPVARIFGNPGVALGSEGAVFVCRRSLRGLPLLKTPASAHGSCVAFCSPMKGETLAYVCEKVKSMDQFRAGTVEVDSKGSVYLHNGFGARVKLGPSERMEEKLAKLAEILRERPEILRQVKDLILISPSRAVYVPRTQGVAQ